MLCAFRAGLLLGDWHAIFAEHPDRRAARVTAVRHVRSCRFAVDACAEWRGLVIEINVHPLVEDIERTVPQSLRAELLAVPDDSALDLVDLVEAAVLHEHAEDLAAHTARAVRDDRLVLEMVPRASIELLDEVVAGAHVRHDRVLELADLRLERIASIEEHDVVTTPFHKLVDLLGPQVFSPADDAFRPHLHLVRRPECHQLGSLLDAEPWEVGGSAIGPLHVHLLETGVLLGGFDVLLEVLDRSAQRHVESLRRDDDAAGEVPPLAEGALPQFDRRRVGDGSERVEEDDPVCCHIPIIRWGVGRE